MSVDKTPKTRTEAWLCLYVAIHLFFIYIFYLCMGYPKINQLEILKLKINMLKYPQPLHKLCAQMSPLGTCIKREVCFFAHLAL